jgi:hypothetical protein
VKETKDVVEGCSELRRNDLALWSQFSILRIWQDADLQDGKTFSRQPDNLMVQLKRLGVSRGVQFPKLPSAVELPGEDDGDTKNLVEGL